MTFTNSITAGNVISASSLFLHSWDTSKSLGANSVMAICGASNYGTLGGSDFNAANSTLQSDTTFSIAGWTTGWHEFPLNATGKSNTPIGGSFYACARDQYHDLSGNAPSANATDYIAADNSTYLPYQANTYAPAAAGSRLVGESVLVGAAPLVGHSALFV
jgi:hypothetical protein